MDANLKSIPYVNKNGIAGKKKKTTLVSKILSAFSRYNKFNVEDIQKNGEGLDAKVLIEAMNITEEDLSAPMSGEDLLLELLG